MFWCVKFVYQPRKHVLGFVVKNKPLKSVEVRFYGIKHIATNRKHKQNHKHHKRKSNSHLRIWAYAITLTSKKNMFFMRIVISW